MSHTRAEKLNVEAVRGQAWHGGKCVSYLATVLGFERSDHFDVV